MTTDALDAVTPLEALGDEPNVLQPMSAKQSATTMTPAVIHTSFAGLDSGLLGTRAGGLGAGPRFLFRRFAIFNWGRQRPGNAAADPNGPCREQR